MGWTAVGWFLRGTERNDGSDGEDSAALRENVQFHLAYLSPTKMNTQLPDTCTISKDTLDTLIKGGIVHPGALDDAI